MMELNSSNFFWARALTNSRSASRTSVRNYSSIFVLQFLHARLETIQEASTQFIDQHERLSLSEGRCTASDQRIHTTPTFDHTHSSTTKAINSFATPRLLRPRPTPPNARPHMLTLHAPRPRNIHITRQTLVRDARPRRKNLGASGTGQHADPMRSERYVQP